jgi:hypothetical protein
MSDLTPVPEDQVFKFNPNHDEVGRFAESSDGPAPSIPSDHEQAIARYTSENSSAINQHLRFGKEADASTLADIATLDKVIDQNRAPADVTVHRSITRDMAKALDKSIAKSGGQFTDKGFVSTTRKERFAELRGEAYVSIEVPKGSKALDIDPWSKKPEEDETLLGRGQTFIARKDPAKANHYFVKLVSK